MLFTMPPIRCLYEPVQSINQKKVYWGSLIPPAIEDVVSFLRCYDTVCNAVQLREEEQAAAADEAKVSLISIHTRYGAKEESISYVNCSTRKSRANAQSSVPIQMHQARPAFLSRKCTIVYIVLSMTVIFSMDAK